MDRIEIFKEGYAEKTIDFMLLYLQKLEKLSTEERTAIIKTVRLLNMSTCLFKTREQST